MSRRDRIDPETARLVEERLQWLLREHGPGPAPDRPPESYAAVGRADPTREPPAGPDRPAKRVRAGPASPRDRTSPPDRSTASRGSNLAPSGPEADLGESTVPVGRGSRSRAGGGLLTSVAAFRRPHLVVVAAIVALGILVAGWAVLRARPVAVAVTPPVSSSPAVVPAQPSTRPATSPSPSLAGVVVHVLGAVRKPGLVTLVTGSRVQDAIEAAGGLTGKADPGDLNLAQAVTDGQQIVVGTKNKPAGEVRNGGAGGGSAGAGAGGSAPGSGQPVDLNTAGLAELEGLPGVGPVMAGKIVAWRTENGRFSRVEELQEIDGVGPKTYAKLAPLCRV